VYARIDRKRKLPITTLLRALPAEDPSTGFQLDTSSNEAILKLFDNSIFIALTLEKDATTREEEALIEVFKKQRPGEPPTLDNARNRLKALFFDPKRYDLTKVGRYKLNQRLGVNGPEDRRVLTTDDILWLLKKRVALHNTRPRAPSRASGTSSSCRTRSSATRSRRTSPPTRSCFRAIRSAVSSTSTSTSATAGCGPSAS